MFHMLFVYTSFSFSLHIIDMSDSARDEEAVPVNAVLEAENENDVISEVDQAEQGSEIKDDIKADDDEFLSDPLEKVTTISP